MRNLLVAALLAMTTTTSLLAETSIEVTVSRRYCLEAGNPAQQLASDLLAKARNDCVRANGYPNAQMLSRPIANDRVISFGYEGCSLIKAMSLTSKFKCLIGNR